MKAKLTILTSVVFMIAVACTSSRTIAGTNVSIYTEIPLAPNVVLTVEAPVIATPGPDYIWIDGYWTWNYSYREYVWVQGYWALAPYHGAFWIPGYWEHYRGGYRWVDACWLPRDHHFSYGYCNGRYDYYGRPVYYDQPRNVRTGHAYAYDNRPEYRSKGYSSSPRFNDSPRSERNRITREYRRQTNNSTSPANTNRNKQETIRIRDNDNNRTSREPSSTRPANREGSRSPATATPSRTQPDNNRQNANSNARPSRSSESGSGTRVSSGENRTRESAGSNSNSNSNRSSNTGQNSRTSSSGSSRR